MCFSPFSFCFSNFFDLHLLVTEQKFELMDDDFFIVKHQQNIALLLLLSMEKGISCVSLNVTLCVF